MNYVRYAWKSDFKFLYVTQKTWYNNPSLKKNPPKMTKLMEGMCFLLYDHVAHIVLP